MQTAQRPPAAQKKSKNNELHKLLSTRSGLAAVAAFAALLAGMMLLVFLQHYRKSLTDETTRSVLVAKSVIPKGSSGDVVAGQDMFQVSKVRGNQVKAGAISDPKLLQGKVSAATVYPGQQLTAGDFTVGSNAVNTKIGGAQRAISVPVDSAHGMVGNLNIGDHVDVYASFGSQQGGNGRAQGVVKVLLRNAVVLRTTQAKGQSGGSNSAENVVLQTPDNVTPQVAYTVDYGKVWIVERPQAGAKDSTLSPVTMQSILSAVKPGGGR